jgi:hypothetical protein
VPIEVTSGVMGATTAQRIPTSKLKDAASLAAWMMDFHAHLCSAGTEERGAIEHVSILLTAGPAAGKTSLMSQVVMHTLADATELVPLVVKVQRLQKARLEHPEAFETSWNWLDAYVRLEYGGDSAVYRMLRQAMMGRHALILLDGLDEGGTLREQIEKHVAEVLAPQGHVMLVTSRPTGIDESRFGRFYRLSLSPLTAPQQEQAVTQRLGATRAVDLLPYLREKVPYDEAGLRVTSNPLMLSMVVSIFELRQGLVDSSMPSTVAELYEVAAEAMLERGEAVTSQIKQLLMSIFFEAHQAADT